MNDASTCERPDATSEVRAVEAAFRKTALFGEGSDSLFRSRASPELIGLPVAALRPLNAVGAGVHLEDEALFTDVRLSSWVIPALIAGTIDQPEIAGGQRLAVGVNGRIAGTARSFKVGGSSGSAS